MTVIRGTVAHNAAQSRRTGHVTATRRPRLRAAEEREHRHDAAVVGRRAGDDELAQQVVDVLIDRVFRDDQRFAMPRFEPPSAIGASRRACAA
jgi:hypothetical protein